MGWKTLPASPRVSAASCLLLPGATLEALRAWRRHEDLARCAGSPGPEPRRAQRTISGPLLTAASAKAGPQLPTSAPAPTSTEASNGSTASEAQTVSSPQQGSGSMSSGVPKRGVLQQGPSALTTALIASRVASPGEAAAVPGAKRGPKHPPIPEAFQVRRVQTQLGARGLAGLDRASVKSVGRAEGSCGSGSQVRRPRRSSQGVVWVLLGAIPELADTEDAGHPSKRMEMVLGLSRVEKTTSQALQLLLGTQIVPKTATWSGLGSQQSTKAALEIQSQSGEAIGSGEARTNNRPTGFRSGECLERSGEGRSL